ncbi:MAG TPA: hypothetical protein VF576_07910 [Rubricoccaceae bacterium]|jgi:hypothetical protein
MALTDRFSPFGIALLAALLLGLLFFAFLMSQRGDDPADTGGVDADGTEQTDGRAATGR